MEKIISCGLALIAITFLILAFAVQGQESVITADRSIASTNMAIQSMSINQNCGGRAVGLSMVLLLYDDLRHCRRSSLAMLTCEYPGPQQDSQKRNSRRCGAS